MRGVIIVNGYHRQLTPDTLERQVTTLNRKADLTACTTDFPGHARHIAARAAASGADVVVAVGGDGTLNEVINGVVGTQTAVAILPSGTANDFAAHMHICEKEMLTISGMEACWTRRVDLIRVNDWYFATVGGMGLPCETLERAEYLKRDTTLLGRFCRALGPFSYLLSMLSLGGTLSRSRGRVSVESDSSSFTCDPVSIVIANQPMLGHTFTVAPKAVNTDGRCDLFIIQRSSHITGAIRAVAQTIGPGRHELDNIIRLQSSRLVLSCEEKTKFFGDGEVRLDGYRFDIEVMPRALWVLVPPVAAARTAYPARHRTTHTVYPAHRSSRPIIAHRTRT